MIGGWGFPSEETQASFHSFFIHLFCRIELLWSDAKSARLSFPTFFQGQTSAHLNITKSIQVAVEWGDSRVAAVEQLFHSYRLFVGKPLFICCLLPPTLFTFLKLTICSLKSTHTLLLSKLGSKVDQTERQDAVTAQTINVDMWRCAFDGQKKKVLKYTP